MSFASPDAGDLTRRQTLGTLGVLALTNILASPACSQVRGGVDLADFVSGDEVDHTAALQRAIDAGGGVVHVPDGIFVIDVVKGNNVHLHGRGTLRKKPGTKGVMLYLSGSNRIEGLTIDYDWPRCEQSAPYANNIAIYQRQGALSLVGVTCRRSFFAAVYLEGGSLRTDADCAFVEAIPHNGARGRQARPSHYIFCVSDGRTDDQTITVTGGRFVGSSLDRDKLHLNPTGIFVTPSVLDGARFRAVSVTGTSFTGCSTNCGDGNVTGAIEIYNGADNVVIDGVTIRLFTYAGIKVQNSSGFDIRNNTVSDGVIPPGAYLPHANGCVTTQKVRGSRRAQSGGRILKNRFSGMRYVGINNSCNQVAIADNIIDGVGMARIGDGIHNAGNDVSITGNVGRDIAGVQISSSGDRCRIVANRMESSAVAVQTAMVFSGTGAIIQRNQFRALRGSGGSGIRTNGPASSFSITDNLVEGFPYGVDIRTTSGAVRNGEISRNTYIGKGSATYISSEAVAVRVI